MWSKLKLIDDLAALRVQPGDAVLVHSSLRQIGPINGGADSLIEALLEVVGPTGTVLAPAFCLDGLASDEWISSLLIESELDADPPTVGVSTDSYGVFPERVRLRPDATRSDHPYLAFAAIGANAEYLTRGAPFQFPLGSGSPLARLHQLNGGVLLLGVGHAKNAAIHLAEVWADVPWTRRKANVRTGPNTWQEMVGAPECSAGFVRLEPLLRQARILREGKVGDAPSQYMRMQHLVGMAVEVLRGDLEGLLCLDPDCRWCVHARKLSEKQMESNGMCW